MYTEEMAFLVFLLTLILSLISWGIQISVARKLKKSGTKPGVQVGKRSWIRPFVLGWRNAEQLGIQTLMIVWSVILGLAILGVIATALLFASIYQP